MVRFGRSNADADGELDGADGSIHDLSFQLFPEAFRRESDGWTIPGNGSLSEFERRTRLACFFDPYHEAIAAMLADFRRIAL